MKTNVNMNNTLTKLSEMKGTSTFQILEYEDLRGGKDVRTAFMLSYMRDANIKLRQLRIVLNGGGVYTESRALSFMRGQIEVSANTGGLLSLSKKFLTSKISGEPVIKPHFQGSGELLLEPSFGHYAMLELENEEIIIDDSLFFAAEDQVEIGVVTMKTVSSALFGTEGFFQTRLKGKGIVVLEIPVPETEIFKYALVDDTLKVDGNFSILRTGGIAFTVEKTTKTLIGSGVTGEGLLNVFKGTGEVWLMPTKVVYENLLQDGLPMGVGGLDNTVREPFPHDSKDKPGEKEK
ncbi:AIM24 family protein [Proteiniclasticum sp. BAD-10]|uniref:AIM24 family protein n=1 Tax=Proteiniclasticum sediminis TaxID=2804028 RepID=A0A941CQC4_9CLOT|nr:AIM24 family protein [Proteiniclasticum sediminis]MBR0576950.1 AIM24 family protein [Proteiniclasticum sediminis]